jgi:hypothetical protein
MDAADATFHVDDDDNLNTPKAATAEARRLDCSQTAADKRPVTGVQCSASGIYSDFTVFCE